MLLLYRRLLPLLDETVMVQVDQDRNRDRIKSAAAVAAFHALLGYALIAGLGYSIPADIDEKLKLFNVAEELPPPPVAQPARAEEMEQKPKPKDPEGAASPANLKNTPSPIVAPPREVRLEVPSPVIAAPVAAQGSAPAAGAAEIPGPGTGADGQGTGRGSGSAGDGTGGGGGGGVRRGAEWVRGAIVESDYPPSALRTGAGGTVYLRFVVGTNGRVSQCRVTRSSGHRDLDATTCRLIERRFLYRPARDGWGRPVPELVVGQHEWSTERRMTEIEIEEPPNPYRY